MESMHPKFFVMGFLDFLGNIGNFISNTLTAPFDAVSGLFNSVTGLSDSWKTMTGRGDTSSMSQAKDMYDYQMQNQMNLMKYGNDLQLAQWNRENEYNTPTAQLERLKAAGLNPLFHSLDGNSSGGLSAVSAPQGPDLGSLLNAVGATMQMRFQQMQTRAQVKLLDAQADKTKQEAKNLETEGAIRNIELMFKKEDEQFWLDDRYMTDEEGRVGYFTADGEFIPITSKDHPGYTQNYLYKNSQSISQFTKQVDELDEAVEKARRENRLESLRESNYEQLVANELRKSNASAEEAEWAAKQAMIIFGNLITEGQQLSLDLGNDTELDNIERKFGLAGDAVKMLVDIVKMVRGRSSRR